MKSEHTRGPWVVLPEEVDRAYIRVRGTQLGGRYKVANVVSPTYDGVHPREAVETRANATLIAAAPEMLELLQKLIDRETGTWYGSALELDSDVWGDELEAEIKALVAKATGATK